jgi:hypothetical protein
VTGVAKVWDGDQWVQATGGGGAPEFQWYWGTTSAFTLASEATNHSVNFTLVATSATANTKPATFTQIIASTAVEADVVSLMGCTFGPSAGGVNGCALGDLAIGPSGSEQVLVADIGVGNTVGADPTHPRCWEIPVKVPVGSRLSFRWQAARASALSGRVAIMLGTAPFDSPTTIDTLGADTASSTGVAMTQGSYTPIVASASKDYRGFVVCPMNDRTSLSGSGMYVEIGIGPSGSETVYHCSKQWFPRTNEEFFETSFGSAYVNAPCPQGSRISARVYDDESTNWSGGTGTKYYNVVLLGVPA